MNRTSRVMNCSPQALFDILSDGWSYATWVVGAARIRSVDEGFPQPGKVVHHSVGAWPLLLSDETVVIDYDPPREIVLGVKAWPWGEGRVRLTCSPQGEHHTEVVMEEKSTAGPISIIPRPLEDWALRGRNVETLRRLAYLAESGARSSRGPHEQTRS